MDNDVASALKKAKLVKVRQRYYTVTGLHDTTHFKSSIELSFNGESRGFGGGDFGSDQWWVLPRNGPRRSMEDPHVVLREVPQLASAERVAMRNKQLKRFDERTTESQATLTNQGAITQLLEHISTLNDQMDEFTSRIEELNSKLTSKRGSASPQNMPLQAEACNGSGPTSYFISSLGNGSLTGPIMPNSSSSSQLAKESPLMEEYGVSPERFGEYKELCSFFKVLTTGADSDNKVYVSTVHAQLILIAFQRASRVMLTCLCSGNDANLSSHCGDYANGGS
ncbi:Inorganic pyrophosphatase TTM2 [Camellia lanceoleosa]|uniref:Inorganic pyrophosphatase TTM2 n=1 Tax=Camellia lanceoleosa TaxID=1840588 RepID=A0ACC0H404_9ERIC|nr:Inorganic pyrophosphatase TTM2 [Camellia lanceoleosa]